MTLKKERIDVVGRAQQPRLGGRKLYVMFKDKLADSGIKIGRDRFFKVLSDNGLLVVPCQKLHVQLIAVIVCQCLGMSLNL